MKLGELIKSYNYVIEDDLDYNLMQFILNLDVKQEIVNTENVESKEVKKENTKPKSRKRKSNKTFLQKLSKHKQGDAERDFIINILENDYRYESYKYTYIEWVNINVEEYNSEIKKIALKLDVEDPDDIYDYDIGDEIIRMFDIEQGVEDIDKMIDVFKEKVLPPIEVDAVYEEFSDIFEKVVGETRGFLKDLDGKWYKFGNDSYRDCELLSIKYPSFAEAMQNEDIKDHFINCLTYGVDDCLYDYNEKEIIKGWY